MLGKDKYKNKADIPVILNLIKLNQEDTPWNASKCRCI